MLRNLKNELHSKTTDLYDNMTYMKKWMIKHTIGNTVKQEERLVEKRHDKKFANLLKEKHEAEEQQTIQTRRYGISRPTN